MRDYKKEVQNRVDFIRKILKESGASGLVFGNSGGKDCALVGILCKMACENTVGLIMPGSSEKNYESDMEDALALGKQYNIENRVCEIGTSLAACKNSLNECTKLTDTAASNISPRLRMLSLYAFAQSENRLVVGTGNRSEIYIGYFTKWGDGASDLNPIGDLTATEVIKFLEYLDAPLSIRQKPPSAGLYEGQTDEDDIGFSYKELDRYILEGETDNKGLKERIDRMHLNTEHKRRPIPVFSAEQEA